MGTKIRKFMNKESTCGFVFALPFTIGFLMFLLVPMLMSLYYSFCDYNILTPAKFSGLGNYVKMFTGDVTFKHSLKATFYFAFVSVPLKLVFALIVAMILEKNSKMSGFYRAAYYLPSIIGGSVAVAVLWKRMFAVDGTINSLLQMAGIDSQSLARGYQDGDLGSDHPDGVAVWIVHAGIPCISEADSGRPV